MPHPDDCECRDCSRLPAWHDAPAYWPSRRPRIIRSFDLVRIFKGLAIGGRNAPLLLTLALVCSGCAPLLSALQATSGASGWLSSLVDVAEGGSQAYFDRHPSQEREAEVAREIGRAHV